MASLFTEIALILFLAAAFGILFRFLRQPPILAYILTGMFIGPFARINLMHIDALQALGELGVTLLLFVLGLELRVKELRSVGKVAIITGLTQIFFTALVGYGILLLLGFSNVEALYVSIAITFSSTIIIVKLLSDKRDLASLYGRIAVGFLLVQDFVAILMLIFLSGFSTEGGDVSAIGMLSIFMKAAIMVVAVSLASRWILPRLIGKIAHSQETLSLFSIAWVVVIASVVSSPMVGFSIEIGGFLAGLALANSDENLQIVSRMRPLRDFFITIFFVFLGMSMVVANFTAIWIPSLILSLFILIGNPFIMMVIMGFLGYRKRTSFLVALTVAQVSEFSLILVFLGHKLLHLSSDIVSMVVLIGIITFAVSTYMILHGNKLYRFFSPYLDVFEWKEKLVEEEKVLPGDVRNKKCHVILVGVNRAGGSILEALRNEKEDVVVVDFDPDVIRRLRQSSAACVFGDISDVDLHDRLALSHAKLIISTVSDLEDNLILLDSVQKEKGRAKVVVLAEDPQDVRVLREKGADYVMLPHVATGHHIAHLIREGAFDHVKRGEPQK